MLEIDKLESEEHSITELLIVDIRNGRDSFNLNMFINDELDDMKMFWYKSLEYFKY